MHQYYPLTVVSKRAEAMDAVRIGLDAAEAEREVFRFMPGQHLPLRIDAGGQLLRRTYSICSAPGRWPIEIGVRIQAGGGFSDFVAQGLEVGAVIEAMPPTGRFIVRTDAAAAGRYVAFASGSGITPILSMTRALLENEPGSSVTLFYGNRRHTSMMFVEDLFALKNRFPDRLQMHFLFSREAQEFDIAAGRLDAEKVGQLWKTLVRSRDVDAAFVCGPDTMIDDVRSALADLGLPPGRIHSERFGAPRRAAGEAPPAPPAAGEERASVTVILDGHRRHFDMSANDGNLVDAAAAQGIELPYSCKGGVCATCRCRLVEGEVRMAENYGLEPWEVEKGYILACQSVPLTERVTLDYDTP